MKKICYHIKCWYCNGTGKIDNDDCSHCDGAGIHCKVGELIAMADQKLGKNIYRIDLEPLKDSSPYKNLIKPIETKIGRPCKNHVIR